MDETELEILAYQKYRTGYTFAEVRRMLWVDNDDPSTWPKGVTRRTVLGRWREIKRGMFDYDVQSAGGIINFVGADQSQEEVPF
jgi:hypothetical protein